MVVQSLRRPKQWVGLVVLFGILGVAALFHERWFPHAQEQWTRVRNVLRLGSPSGTAMPSAEEGGEHGHTEEHGGHGHAGHEHAGHDESSSLEISTQARKNIGLTVAKVKPGTFERTITVPGMVVERRGQTKMRIVAPLTGIVTRIYAIEGEALKPGQPLFDLRLTHEDLLQAQVEFLKIVEELDVVKREVARIQPVAEKGAVPQKVLLERQYEQQKLDASLRAHREALLLHGLSAAQVDEIASERHLKSSLTVAVPQVPRFERASGTSSTPECEALFVVEALTVESGRLVTAGDLLLTLADYCQLYIAGDAFEQDAKPVANTVRNHWKVTALLNNEDQTVTAIPGLSILYLADEVDPVSRTLHFYVKLPNELTRDETNEGHRFIGWRFRPGQRMQLRIPVEHWPNRIVLPADALVREGAESYVFQENGNHFDRRPVQVEYRDQSAVVIAQDGSLFPGDSVAVSGAQQLQMALKNKSGGAIDPHAGHNH